ncbi:MAG TPA: hypothetical protein VNA13_00105 [Xanthomonadales bacterium]|nr:hypothetical protein [Xanthomonadales bacterium]
MTDDQLIDKLRTVVREEVEAETKKTERDAFFSNVRLGKLVTDLKNSVKDLKISNSRLEKGQGRIEDEQQAQSKTLKYIKTKLNKTAKTVDIIGLRYDERIVDNDRRTDRIEDHLGLPPYKAKQ